ncbi:hypothetical protein EVAR_20872_1 [Eumeta japonica]|uniref:Uncharacterized protein n=1 Tax=Eumeta variegata TaxID=151549 RepID=A0A4C1UWQ5_EUMVA|nr:hypothetical protein EVAR_20872_1 [Eumeta japonica]
MKIECDFTCKLNNDDGISGAPLDPGLRARVPRALMQEMELLIFPLHQFPTQESGNALMTPLWLRGPTDGGDIFSWMACPLVFSSNKLRKKSNKVTCIHIIPLFDLSSLSVTSKRHLSIEDVIRTYPIVSISSLIHVIARSGRKMDRFDMSYFAAARRAPLRPLERDVLTDTTMPAGLRHAGAARSASDRRRCLSG